MPRPIGGEPAQTWMEYIRELEVWIRDAQPLIASGLRDPKVTTQEYARHLDTRRKILFPK